MFPDYIIRKPPKHPLVKQFGLYNPNSISTNSRHVCNKDSHFRDNINLPNPHPSVLGHCYLFLVKNRVFRLLDRIAPKLPQKKFKDHDSPRMDFLQDSAPQNPKFHRLDPFLIFFNFSYSQKNLKKFALVLFDF